MFEAGLIQELSAEATSTAVRKAQLLGKERLADRARALDTNARIAKNSELTPELKAAGKRHELRSHMEKSDELKSAMVAAAEDIARLTPAIDPAQTAGAASIDTELRTLLRGSSEDARKTLLTDPTVQLAVARAPAALSGIGSLMHASITDAVRRRLFPDAMAARDQNEAALEAVQRAYGAHRETARSLFGGPRIETHATKITTAA